MNLSAATDDTFMPRPTDVFFRLELDPSRLLPLPPFPRPRNGLTAETKHEEAGKISGFGHNPELRTSNVGNIRSELTVSIFFYSRQQKTVGHPIYYEILSFQMDVAQRYLPDLAYKKKTKLN